MRKRAIYLFLAAAALATGCVKWEGGIVNNSISFSPVASKTTRSIIDGTTYPTSESFAVSAFHDGTDAYFENLTATYSSSLTLWATDEDQFWPLSGSLSFIAYSPASASAEIDATAGVTATSYTIQTAAQMTTDFCYASASVADCAAHPEYVPLNFSHALSQIVFRVKAADYYSTASNTVTLTLNSLSLSGIYAKGDFADEEWSNQNTEYDYPLSSAVTPLTYDGSNKPETIDVCSFLFIPQTLGPNATLSVGFGVIQNIAGVENSLEQPPMNIPMTTGTVTEWQPGKKYIYTLNIGMDKNVKISASTVGWTDRPYEIIVEEN